MSRGTERDLRRGAALGLLLGLAASSAGCALLLGGLRTAPSGLSASDQELRSLLADGRSGKALELLEGKKASGRVGDELLRLQFLGLAAHYAGRWEESSRALERAFGVAEDRYTKSASRALLSMLTSDRILAYDPPRPERLFLHYYGALNYLHRGEPDEAAVEARRLGYALQRALDGEDSSVPPDLGRALSVFAGAVFEAAGQSNDAAVSYRRARAYGEGEEGEDSAPEADPWARSESEPPGEGAGPVPTGRVLVVLERGFVAHKVERDVTLFLRPEELGRLQRYRRAAAADTASPEPAEILELAERVAARSLGAGSRWGLRRRARSGDADLVFLRVAWPELREASAPAAPATLRAADGDSTAELRARAEGPRFRADLSRAVREAHRGSQPRRVAKSLMRALAKLSIAEGIEEAVSEEDETLGEVLGAAAQVGGALLERADTRSWHLLPGRLELYLLRLPPGTHRLEARVGRGGGAGGRIPVGPVEVEAGRLRVVTAREWR